MVIKRNNQQVHETIQMDNGAVVHFFDGTETIDNLKKEEEDCKEAYDRQFTILNRINYATAKAQRMQAEGDIAGAAELLATVIEKTTDIITEPCTLLSWMDCLTLEAELLLRLKRSSEALKYAERVNRIALEHFAGTVELLYATELYGVCFQACGKDKDAQDVYTGTLNDIEREIFQLEELRDGIKANLEELKK